MGIEEVLNYPLGSMAIRDYWPALLVFIAVVIFIKVFKIYIVARLKSVSAKTVTDWDDVILNLVDDIGSRPFYIFIALYFALKYASIPDLWQTIFGYIAFVLVAFYVIRAFQHLINHGINKFIEKRQKEEHRKNIDESAIRLLGFFLKFLLWAIAVIMVVSNLGYNVSGLIAGIGIGGIAIAFALQKILADIFSSISIYFDKPFRTGDYITAGDEGGTVKKIGIKSTRLQSLQGEEIVMSNSDLTSATLHNFKKMKKRRISFKFGVTYETSNKKLKKIDKIVKDFFKKAEKKDIELNRFFFTEMGDFALTFAGIYYMPIPDYAVYLEFHQSFLFYLKEQFEKAKIEFAYPTQKVFTSKA